MNVVCGHLMLQVSCLDFCFQIQALHFATFIDAKYMYFFLQILFTINIFYDRT